MRKGYDVQTSVQQQLRGPPLSIKNGEEVIVVNGDRLNLTWKRYKLSEILQNGQCVVQGIADARQRTFPRSVVKPKNWIKLHKKLYQFIASESASTNATFRKQFNSKHIDNEIELKANIPLDMPANTGDDVIILRNGGKPRSRTLNSEPGSKMLEFHSFRCALKLFGVNYKYQQIIKIFQSLDESANGCISFQQFMNFIHGVGRTEDRGLLQTTVECIIHCRSWDTQLPFYVYQPMNDNDMKIDMEETNDRVSLMNTNEMNTSHWMIATYDQTNSNENVVRLVNSNGQSIEIPNNTRRFLIALREELKMYWKKNMPQYVQDKSDERVCNMVVMGPGRCGKSALLSKWVRGIFPHEYDPTIQDHYRKPISVNEKPALLNILDTAGQVEFSSMRYDWIQDNADVLLLCFSRSDHQSFRECQQLLICINRLLMQLNPPRMIPIVLVNTKTDLYDGNRRDTDHTRLTGNVNEVSNEEIDVMLRTFFHHPFIQFVECSALMDEHVNDVFHTAVTLYRKWTEHFDGGFKNSGISQGAGSIVLNDRWKKYRDLRMNLRLRDQEGGFCRFCYLTVISFFGECCPGLFSYVNTTDVSAERRKTIDGVNQSKVAKFSTISKVVGKFSDDLQEPVYSVRYFYVARQLGVRTLLGAFLYALLVPFIIFCQTWYFICFCSQSPPSWYTKVLPVNLDLRESTNAIYYDILAGIVGRDPNISDIGLKDLRKWFMSQTTQQKVARFILGHFIVALFAGAVYVAHLYLHEYLTKSFDEANVQELTVVEIVGPLGLYFLIWTIMALYMSFDVEVKPKVPSMQSLRPFVMYFGEDESLRTTAYVFLRGFAKSTLEIARLEASWHFVIISIVAAVIYSFFPHFIRVGVDKTPFWSYDTLAAIFASVVNLFFIFVLVLGIQMQLLSGLSHYVQWMEDVTSMLDINFSKARNNIPFLCLTRHNNTLGWIEIRTFLHTKGLLISSRQEIWVLSMIFICSILAIYDVNRLFTEPESFESASFDSALWLLAIMFYTLIRFLRVIGRLEQLQKMQISLLASQRYQIEFKRVNWHPPKEDDMSVANDDFDDYEDVYDVQNEMDIPVDISQIPALDVNSNCDMAVFDVEQQNGYETIGSTTYIPHLVALDQLKMDVSTAIPFADGQIERENEEHIYSAEYLEQSEKFVQSVIGICQAQDIIPRVFGIKIHTLLGLTLLITISCVGTIAVKQLFET